jgi:predicted MPP superfamily phosphohydrolase
MHVSPGLGTTFVPFRFFARPEATELVLTRPVVSAPILT